MAAVKTIPEGYHSVTPYLVVTGAAKLIDFLKHTFDAQEIERMSGPHNSVMHAEVSIGDSRIMISDAAGEWAPMPSTLYVYVKDADAVYRRALNAGAESLREPADQFYGDRNAGVRDPAGNQWWIATHKEDVSAEELEKRAAAMQRGAAG